MHPGLSGADILTARLIRAIAEMAEDDVTTWCPTDPIRVRNKWKPDRLAKAIREAVSREWVEASGDRVRLTRWTAEVFKLTYHEGPTA